MSLLHACSKTQAKEIKYSRFSLGYRYTVISFLVCNTAASEVGYICITNSRYVLRALKTTGNKVIALKFIFSPISAREIYSEKNNLSALAGLKITGFSAENNSTVCRRVFKNKLALREIN